MNTLWRQCEEGRGVVEGKAWKIAEQQKPTCLAFFSSLFLMLLFFSMASGKQVDKLALT